MYEPVLYCILAKWNSLQVSFAETFSVLVLDLDEVSARSLQSIMATPERTAVLKSIPSIGMQLPNGILMNAADYDENFDIDVLGVYNLIMIHCTIYRPFSLQKS